MEISIVLSVSSIRLLYDKHIYIDVKDEKGRCARIQWLDVNSLGTNGISHKV